MANPNQHTSTEIHAHFLYNTTLFDKLNFSKFFKTTYYNFWLPETLTLKTRYNYTTRLNKLYFNYTSLRHLTKETSLTIANTKCNCSHYHNTPYLSTNQNHVLTTNMSFFTSPITLSLYSNNPLDKKLSENLTNLLKLGTKYKPPPSCTLEAFQNSVKEGISGMHKTLCRIYPDHQNNLGTWKNLIIKDLMQQTTTLHNNTTTKPKHTSNTLYLKTLHSHYFLAYVDKNAKSYALLCKTHTIHKLLTDYNIPTQPNTHILNTNPNKTYIIPTRTDIILPQYLLDTSTLTHITDILKLIIAYHNNWLLAHNFPKKLLNNKIPLAYPALKVHKLDLFRPIAASCGCTMEILSKALALGLNLLNESLTPLWNSRFEAKHQTPHPIWLINDIHIIPTRIKNLNTHTLPHENLILETYDFSDLYTGIPLTDLKEILSTLIFELWKIHTTRHEHWIHINLKQKEACWTATPPQHIPEPYHLFFNYTKFTEYLCFLLDNSYIQAAGHILKQVIGIPMGTNAAVFIANFFLFHYELTFITHLLNTNLTLLKHFEHTSRFLDDLLSIHNPYFNQYKQRSNECPHGIYPNTGLVLNLEHSALPSIQPCNFLDSRICLNKNKKPYTLYTTLYTKSRDIKYGKVPYITLPPYTSGLAGNCKNNLMLTLLTRVNLVCQRQQNFINEAALIVKQLRNLNYPLQILKRKLVIFLNKPNTSLYTNLTNTNPNFRKLHKKRVTFLTQKILNRQKGNFTSLLKHYT